MQLHASNGEDCTEGELTSEKNECLAFHFSEYSSWESSFSPGGFLLMILNNSFTSLIMKDQLTSP